MQNIWTLILGKHYSITRPGRYFMTGLKVSDMLSGLAKHDFDVTPLRCHAWAPGVKVMNMSWLTVVLMLLCTTWAVLWAAGLLIMVILNHSSVYGDCFHFMWRHLEWTAAVPQGAPYPAKYPHILRVLWEHTELIISVNGCSPYHRSTPFECFARNRVHQQDDQKLVVVFSSLREVIRVITLMFWHK